MAKDTNVTVKCSEADKEVWYRAAKLEKRKFSDWAWIVIEEQAKRIIAEHESKQQNGR